MVLHVAGTAITEVGFVSQPAPTADRGYPNQIRRSLLIGTTLWTVSDGGLMASDAATLARLAWIPLR